MSELVIPPPGSKLNSNQELPKVSMEEAVTVTKAVASYGNTRILKSLSMKVTKGTVYALLGQVGVERKLCFPVSWGGSL